MSVHARLDIFLRSQNRILNLEFTDGDALNKTVECLRRSIFDASMAQIYVKLQNGVSVTSYIPGVEIAHFTVVTAPTPDQSSIPGVIAP